MSDKERLRHEIVEMTADQVAAGLATPEELRQVTLRMLGRDALPKVPPMSAREIAKLREAAGVSQAVFGGYLNVTAQTVSSWENGERKPTGPSLKLLHVVKTRGLESLR